MEHSPSQALLQLCDISKSFGAKTIINKLNLSIEHGEFLTLLGPSGCGKTTLLRIIAGLESQDCGQVILSNENISQIPAEKRQVNTVFQSYALFPHMSVLDNVMFGLKMHRVPKKQALSQAIDTLKMVKLSEYHDHFPNELSGGQQQRVAIARAIVNRPKILLLDEPLSALDYKLRQEMQLELKRLQRQLDITFIFVTHDQEEALSMSDRIVVLKDGCIQQIGTPKEIYETPSNLFVAKFIGQTNIFQATIVNLKENNVYQATIAGKNVDIYSETELSPEQNVHIILRPEDIRINEVTKQHESSMLMGTIIDLTYKGMTLDSVIEMDNGDKVLISEFFDEDDPDTEHTIGQRVEVSWVPSWEVVLTNAAI